MKQDEFYIGWMPQSPAGFAKHTRKLIVFIFLCAAFAAVLLALLQKKFSTSTFEYGRTSEIKGVYQQFPVPSLKVITDKDRSGNRSYITIPLVGYGKFGAEGVIAQLEKENTTSLDGKQVTLKGTLLYSDGKTLLQIDKHDDPLVRFSDVDPVSKSAPTIRELGNVQLTGEILDPKCYFGVMKPGHGKPHRDCAIRCIAGGMSPVFYVRNEKGETDYYLILGTRGEKINDQLKEHIAEPVSLDARAVRYDDWVILYTDPGSIKRTGGLSWFKMHNDLISCKPPSRK